MKKTGLILFILGVLLLVAGIVLLLMSASIYDGIGLASYISIVASIIFNVVGVCMMMSKKKSK